jgi:hypothetical protein
LAAVVVPFPVAPSAVVLPAVVPSVVVLPAVAPSAVVLPVAVLHKAEEQLLAVAVAVRMDQVVRMVGVVVPFFLPDRYCRFHLISVTVPKKSPYLNESLHQK